jgi:NAD(P)-dependent dehydrogenase (short-subunit alcohol dehydrogenase family)
LAHFGRVDALINNAGSVEPLKSVAETSPRQWYHNIGTNLLGPYFLIHRLLPELRRRRGRIITIGSGAANIPIPAASAYCAAKAAIKQLTRVLALEEPKVTSLAVRPGNVDTAMQAYLRRHAPDVMPRDYAAYYWRIWKEGRLQSPAVPARAISWLALHAPAEWSGETIDIDDPRIAAACLEETTFAETQA